MATTDIKTLQIKKDENTIYKLTIEDLLKKSEADDYYAPINATANCLTQEDADGRYQLKGGLDENNEPISLGDYAKKTYVQSYVATSLTTYATLGDVQDCVASSLSDYSLNGHTHIVDEISDLTLSNYIPTSSTTNTISSNNASSTLIPTVAAIVSYINSQAIPNGSSIAFPVIE